MFDKVMEKLEGYQLEDLAKDSRFYIIEKKKKITATAFVGGLLEMFHGGHFSLCAWAHGIAARIGDSISEEGLRKKLTFRHEVFALTLLRRVMSGEDKLPEKMKEVSAPLFKDFGRVLIEDSSCLSFPKNLADEIPGSNSRTGKASTAKIQLLIDLKTDEHLRLVTGSFRDSDGAHSKEIFHVLGKGDLVIRDLGYWSIDVFEGIEKRGGYFLNPLKRGVGIFDGEGTPLDLYKLLKVEEAGGNTRLDREIWIGAKKMFKVRFIAIKRPKKLAAEARRKAKANRDRRQTCTKKSLYLAEWELIITNVPVSVWDGVDAARAYNFRWRIEIIFKCWKSGLGLAKMFEKQSMSPSYARIILYLALVWISLVFIKDYRYFFTLILQLFDIRISLLKFAFYHQTYSRFIQRFKETNCNQLLKMIANYCKYDKRKGRINHEEKLILT